MPNNCPTIAIFYHFFPPDDVVSAVEFGELSAGLVERGWDVTAYPCLWSCHRENARYPSAETRDGVKIKRLWRPRLRQSSSFGRLCNSAWMIARWSMLALTARPRPDVILVGTDPVMSLLVAPIWKRIHRNTRIAHWCFDLYPEAAIYEGLVAPNGALIKILNRWLRAAYRACSLIADLGPCMRQLLLKYPSQAERETFVPWAIAEPGSPLPVSAAERNSLFGDAPLALLYSGNFGRAHGYHDLLNLAERLVGPGGRLVFSVRGNRVTELREAVRQKNIPVQFVPFADENKLLDRLACADIHVVSLQADWTGAVLPSKFFGALAAGRPVLFSGSSQCSIAMWIHEHKVGWVVTAENADEVALQLIEYIRSPQSVAAMQQRCAEVYRKNFSRVVQLDHWDRRLRSLLDPSRSPTSAKSQDPSLTPAPRL